MKMIYFDNNATTSVSKSVLESMMPFFSDMYGNPSSIYPFGLKARHAIDVAREAVSKLINCKTDEVVFTSGGTESNVTAIMSYVKAFPHKKHIICSPLEHYSVLSTMRELSDYGYKIDFLPVDVDGRLDYTAISDLINDDTLMVIAMLANNETGTINYVNKIRDYTSPYKVFIHTDAVQAIGKKVVDVYELNVDSLSMSGHKFHGPKGIGALYYKSDNPFYSYIFGHQESNHRGGTENVSGIVGLGQAAFEVSQNLEDRIKTLSMLQSYLESRLNEIQNIYIIAQNNMRLCNTTNFAIKDIDGTKLMLLLAHYGIYVSTGSACNAGTQGISHVLSSMRISDSYNKSIRVSFDTVNSISEIDQFIRVLKIILSKEK